MTAPDLSCIATALRESAYTAEELGHDDLCADLSRAAEDLERHVAGEGTPTRTGMPSHGPISNLLTPEDQKALTADLQEIARKRRRAADSAAQWPMR